MRGYAGEDAQQVLVFNSWPTTPQRRSRRWGRESEPQSVPAETGLGRATIVDSHDIAEAEAESWLADLTGDAARVAVDEALKVLNQAIRAHRAAAIDPIVREVDAHWALAIRAGYGHGDEVADGSWSAAKDVDVRDADRKSRRERRLAALRPQERIAAVLGGRDAVLACEELVLRARADLDADCQREAALQAHVAVEAAISEFQAFRSSDQIARRLDELVALRAAVSDAANEALQGGLRPQTLETVGDAVRRVESLLRARSASAAY